MTAKTYRVPDHGMQVVPDGTVYRPGEVFEADTREARRWARNGLVAAVGSAEGSDQGEPGAEDRPAQLGAGFAAANGGKELTGDQVEQKIARAGRATSGRRGKAGT